MARLLLVVVSTLVILQEVVGPPVTSKKPEEAKKVDAAAENQQDLGDAIEYNRYLKEVVSALESDPEFREKLEKAEEVDIRTGKIAHELEYVNHHVRNKLDELKRQELERLRHFASKEYELRNDIDTEHIKITKDHVDHSNPNTFEIEDLRKLIAKTTADLAEVDKKRREDFKEYEMQKEFEKQEKLKDLDEEHKKALVQELEEKEQKHKKHEPLHHPGSKQQLEEVWEKQDHMESQDFDPKTFFHLHDLDGNGVWDEDEVKALFLKELDKLYQSGAPEDDMRERAEEMERMREHVFKEADVNKDGLISFQEFLAQTQKPEFEKDEGWDGIDQQQVYTQNEYEEFERRRQADVQRMIAQGLIPPHPNAMPHQGYPQHGAPPHQQFQGQQHPGQVPQYHPGQQQYHPGQVPQGQMHPNQVPQYHPNQVHPGQQGQQGHPNQAGYHPGQQQGHPNQVPQAGYHPGQVAPGQLHPNQAPPTQYHPNQAAQYHPGQGQPNQNQYNPGQAQGYPNQVPQQGQQYQGQVNQGVPSGQQHPAVGVPSGQQHPAAAVPSGQQHPAAGVPPQPSQNSGQFHSAEKDSSNQAQAIVQQVDGHAPPVSPEHKTGSVGNDPNAIPVLKHPIQPASHENKLA